MIALDSGQAQIASRSTAQMVTLVKLDTFSDYTAATIDETFYFASVPISYKWDGVTAVQFRGPLKSIDPISRGFEHIPNADVLPTRDGMSIEFDASEWAGEFPWNDLTSKNLIGAKVTVASLLVDWPDPRPDNWEDQSTLGAVHTVRFRGEVTDVPEYDDEGNSFSLVFDSIEPVLPWAAALDASEVSEKDLGKTYPIPVGNAKRVPLVQRQVGWFTTLGSNIDETTTGNVFVTDTTGLPASPTVFGMVIGTERISAIKVDATAINITGRGLPIGGVTTTAQKHNVGAVMIEELASARFVYSGVDHLGITALYARSPNTGELVLIPPWLYSALPADKELDSGQSLGVVTFTQEEWATVIRLLNKEAAITQQPAVATSGVETVQIPIGSYSFVSNPSNAVNSNLGFVNDGGVLCTYGTGGATDIAFVGWNESGSVPQQSRSVVRFRLVVKMRVEGDGTNATLVYYNFPSFVFGASKVKTLLRSYNPASNATTYETVSGAWITPPGGTTLADLVNGSGSPTTAGARVLLYLDQGAGGTSAQTEVYISRETLWEVELTPLPVSVTQNTETTGAQEVGFNLDLFADIQGAVTLGSEVSESEFDDSTGWAGFDATISDVGAAGDGFTVTGDGTATIRTAALTGISPALDFTGARFRFDYRLASATLDMFNLSSSSFRITLLSSAGNWTRWDWSRAVLYHTGWREFTFDPGAPSVQVGASAGTLDLSSVQQINIEWVSTSAASVGVIDFRDLRSEPRTHHTHPIDIAEWLIEENMGIASGADATTFATAKTNLPSVAFGGDLRAAGNNFAEVLARIGFECRTNFVTSEAASQTVIKAFNAQSTYDFPASARTLDEFRGLKTRTKRLDDQPNEFTALYDFRNHLDTGSIEGYAAMLRANASTNDISADVPTVDITDAQARVGVRQSDPLGFFMLPDSASVIEVWAYLVQEALRGDARGHSIRVALPSGYDLEPGDIIDFTPRWSASAIKCRVIKTTFPFRSASVGLNLEEVL